MLETGLTLEGYVCKRGAVLPLPQYLEEFVDAEKQRAYYGKVFFEEFIPEPEKEAPVQEEVIPEPPINPVIQEETQPEKTQAESPIAEDSTVIPSPPDPEPDNSDKVECPFCKGLYKNLKNHIKQKHPDHA